MQSLKRLRLLPMLLALPLAVSACATRVETKAVFPSLADLKVKPKPKATDEIVTNAQAEAAYNAAIEAWGEDGWLQVARLCRWSKANGNMVDCPAAPKP